MMSMKRLVLVAVLATAGGFGQTGMLAVTGPTGIVNVPDAPDLNPSGAFTIEAWFYFDPGIPGTPGLPTLVRKGLGPHPYILRIDMYAGNVMEFIVWCVGQGSPVVLQTASAMPVLSWHHVAGTYDLTTMRIFIDGVLAGSMPLSGAPVSNSPQSLMLGVGNGSNEVWKGDIDEVRLWSYARNPGDIAADRFTALDLRPGLVGAWHFDGSYADLTGGHTGTPSGAANIVIPSTSPVGATCSLHVTCPTGAGSVSVVNSGCNPLSTYVTAATLNAGAFPHGWFFGVDIPFSALLSLVSVGPPFFGTLDASGSSTFLVPGGIPTGLTFYVVTVVLDPATGLPASSSVPIAFTTC